ncbi:MAG: LamG domain-containing protein [bacterium]
MFGEFNTKNALALYSMNGNANDSSGNNRNGTVTGATLVQGKFGQGYSFNGTTNKIDLAFNPYLIMGSAAFTVETWVYQNSYGYYLPFGNIDASNELFIFLNDAPGNGAVEAGLGAAANRITTPAGIVSTGEWAYIAFTYDTSVIRLYVNGKEYANKTVGTVSPCNANLGLGYRPNGSLYPLNGKIDQTKISNKALTAAEIKGYYNSLKQLA